MGPEWWICPSCERWWRDETDRPDWPVYKCQHCESWEAHELLWCSRCFLVREPDPRPLDTDPRENTGLVEHVPSEPGRIVGEPLRRMTPLETEAIRLGRPLTEAERGALGLTDATGSYSSPDAHRGKCQICGGRPGQRVWCVYCQRGVGPGCCLLCEFPRTDRYRRGMCTQCLPNGGWDASTPIQDVQPVRRAAPSATNARQRSWLKFDIQYKICRSKLMISVLGALLGLLCCAASIASIAGNVKKTTRPQ